MEEKIRIEKQKVKLRNPDYTWIWQEAQKELVAELYNSLEHDDDEDETLYLPLTKLGELKNRVDK